MFAAKNNLLFRAFHLRACVLLVFCLLFFGCGHTTPAIQDGESQQSEVSAKKRQPENETSDSGKNRGLESGETPIQSADRAHLAKASVEKLLLSFWVSGALGPPDSDQRFRYMNWNDAESRSAALKDNRAILEELKSRKHLPKKVLVKYRDCNVKIFTGTSGPYCTIAHVCAALLHEDDEEMPEF